MLIVAGYIDVHGEDRDAYLAARQTAIANTRSEPGCVTYVFSADSSDPGRIQVFEMWETTRDLDTHLELRTTEPSTPPTTTILNRELKRYEIASVGPLRS
jgi:quinol monooxygenase YgiN